MREVLREVGACPAAQAAGGQARARACTTTATGVPAVAACAEARWREQVLQ